MLIPDLLVNSARSRPDNPAVWFNGVWKTFAAVHAEATAVAGFLLASGIAPGERVAILLENSFEYIAAHFGALMAGAVEVSLNTESSAADLQSLLIDCEAKVLIAGRKFYRQWSVAIQDLPELNQLVVDKEPPQKIPAVAGVNVHYWDAIISAETYELSPSPRIDLDLASLVYTSGSTGKPKGVMLSHLNLVSNSKSIAEYLKLRESDRVLVVLPFHYIYGRSILYTQFLRGAAIVIDNRFAFPAVVLDTMEKMEVTGFAGVPSTFSILLKKTDLRSRKFPHLRFVTQAGGGMAPAVQKDVAEVFHPAPLFIMYGTTEAAPRLTFVEPAVLPRKWGSIGRAIPNVEVAVVDAEGKRQPMGVHGEIAARGSNIMLGYWKDVAGTAEVMRNGYYLTGDLGFEDEDGYFFVTGRARDIIKAGGNRVSAKEIEDTILEVSGVLETAVIGVADDILGEAIKAFVVPCDPSLTEEMVKSHLQRKLPAFKHPKWMEFLPMLPKNQSGKIMKAQLREANPKSSERKNELADIPEGIVR